MKQGFTLVELLMVMVIVAILVVVALPKYNGALERSRATEGITLIKDVSDYVNMRYVLNNFTYPAVTAVNVAEIDTLRPVHFNDPTLSWDATNKEMKVAVTRQDGWDYVLTGISKDGELKKIVCTDTNSGEDCTTVGMSKVGTEYIMNMANN